MDFYKSFLIVLGTLSLLMGIIGIVIPGIPTTPFLLLTAGLYVKSSGKLYQKLIVNRFIGSYIVEFRTKKGMTSKAKLLAIVSMWVMITISCMFFITPLTLKLIVIIIGFAGTLIMGFLVSTIGISNRNSNKSIKGICKHFKL